MANATETKLERYKFTGENHHRTFDEHVRYMTDLFDSIERLFKDHGHADIDEHTRKCHLLNSIKMDVAKATIMANEPLRNDIANSDNLLQDVLRHKKDNEVVESTRTVAAASMHEVWWRFGTRHVHQAQALLF